jgi:hypothetical protein
MERFATHDGIELAYDEMGDPALAAAMVAFLGQPAA